MRVFDDSNLKPGDIILHEYHFGEWHSYIYLGDVNRAKPYADSNPHTKYNGVRVSSGTGLIEVFNEFLADDEDYGDTEIYRCADARLAKRAAQYANKWAVDPREYLRGKDEDDVYLATPYDDRRGSPAQGYTQRLTGTDKKGRLTGSSMFRIVKAFIHAEEGKPLSAKRGVSCAMFATYCYQVAAVDIKFPHGASPQGAAHTETLRKLRQKKFDDAKESYQKFANTRDQAKERLTKEKVFYREDPVAKDKELHGILNSIEGANLPFKSGASNLTTTYLRAMGFSDFKRRDLPPALAIDAKTTSVYRLKESLKNDGGDQNRSFRELRKEEFTKEV